MQPVLSERSADSGACPLCGSAPARKFRARQRSLSECGACRLAYSDRAEILPPARLKERYLLHENGPADAGYRAFLSRAVDAARPYFEKGQKGLDYGCGPGPTLSALAACEGLVMTDYDPLFFDVPLDPPYDVVFSTECFEHFEEPGREIARVASLVRPGGTLCVMTELWDDTTDFGAWYYAADPTHVAFYRKETLVHIGRAFGLALVAGDGKRTLVFRREAVS